MTNDSFNIKKPDGNQMLSDPAEVFIKTKSKSTTLNDFANNFDQNMR